MSNDMRIIKFKTMIADVQDALWSDGSVVNERGNSSFFTTNEEMLIQEFKSGKYDFPNPALLFIYDYKELNEYGKIIMDGTCLYLSEQEIDVWITEYNFKDSIDSFANLKFKIDMSKEFIRLVRLYENKEEAYKFIFWSLMILAVDKKDYEQHLSLVCDFARLFNISNNELDDIVKVIKKLFHEDGSEQKINTSNVNQIFKRVLNLYNENNTELSGNTSTTAVGTAVASAFGGFSSSIFR